MRWLTFGLKQVIRHHAFCVISPLTGSRGLAITQSGRRQLTRPARTLETMTQARRSRAAIVVALLVAFILVGWAVGALVTSALTPTDLRAVRDVASDRTAAATVVAHVFSWLGSGFIIFPAALACCVVLYRRGRSAAALAVALSTVGAQLIIDLDKLLVGRQRPPLHHLDHVTGHSFPSGHTGQTAALCAVLVIEAFIARGARPSLYVALVAAALLVGCVAFSRVYLSVHYPSDVVAGAILGASWSAVASWLAHRWIPSGAQSGSQPPDAVPPEPRRPLAPAHVQEAVWVP